MRREIAVTFDRPVGDGVVARTGVRERLDSDNGGVWWKEYRVRRITAREWDAMVASGVAVRFAAFEPFVVETRRVDATVAGVATGGREWNEWRFWGGGATKRKAIADMMGDTDFVSAESLDPAHAEIAGAFAALRAAGSAEYDATRAFSAANVERVRYAARANAEYAKKIAGLEPAAAAKVTARMTAKFAPGHEELKARVAAADKALLAAREAVTMARVALAAAEAGRSIRAVPAAA